ncbi:MAG: TolC family protein [Acidobacteria bacterium]|nr:TolC family protein [Acidobacteriota bacterium]
MAQAIANALASRTDLNVARRQRQSADADVRLLDEQRKPAANLVASYSLNGIGGTQILRQSGALGSEIVGTASGGYLDVLRSIGSLDYPTWTIGLNVSLPLGTRAADAAHARELRAQLDYRTALVAFDLAQEAP